MMMVIYLASLTRSILALHKLIDNKVSRPPVESGGRKVVVCLTL